MKTFQLTLPGYESDGDTTEHLVRWVQAHHRQAVDKFVGYALAGLPPGLEVEELPNPNVVSYDDGIDVILDASGRVISQSSTNDVRQWVRESNMASLPAV